MQKSIAKIRVVSRAIASTPQHIGSNMPSYVCRLAHSLYWQMKADDTEVSWREAMVLAWRKAKIMNALASLGEGESLTLYLPKKAGGSLSKFIAAYPSEVGNVKAHKLRFYSVMEGCDREVNLK